MSQWMVIKIDLLSIHPTTTHCIITVGRSLSFYFLPSSRVLAEKKLFNSVVRTTKMLSHALPDQPGL